MLKDNQAFSSFSVSDTGKAKEFYNGVLGLECALNEDMDILEIQLGTGSHVMLYPKGSGHQPASYTVLNFPVKDIDEKVDSLTAKGVTFLQYDMEMIKTDEKGIARSEGNGPTMAWFTDPDGNILALMQV